MALGGAGATAREYDCLTFDGPGQGYALWKQKLYFKPDWERVITPVVNYALSRHDVDPAKIAIQGISQGGYWVARALAFEKRISAGIADPGGVDVSTSWMETLPPPLLNLLKAGRKAEFDGFLAKALSPQARATLAFRMRPFGFSACEQFVIMLPAMDVYRFFSDLADLMAGRRPSLSGLMSSARPGSRVPRPTHRGCHLAAPPSQRRRIRWDCSMRNTSCSC